MVCTGDFVTPQFNGQPRFDKPPLSYWLMAASGSLFGMHVWALRLPAAACAFATAMGIGHCVSRFGLSGLLEHEAAVKVCGHRYLETIVATSAFALNLMVVAWGSTALSDMVLTATISAALLIFFWGYACKQPKYYMASSYFTALAVLAKGPVGLALPVLICGVFLVYTGEFALVMREEVPWWKAVGIFLSVAVPWYSLMVKRHGKQYLQVFLGYHNLERYTRGVNHHGGRPWWYAVAVISALYFPWSLALPSALARLRFWTRDGRASWMASPRTSRLPLFATAWLLVTFCLFGLSSSQLPSYYLPLAPAVAVLAALQLTAGSSSPGRRTTMFIDAETLTALLPALTYEVLAMAIYSSPYLLTQTGDATAIRVGVKLAGLHLHVFGSVIMLAAGILAAQTAGVAIIHSPHKLVNMAKPCKSAHQQAEPIKEQAPLLPMWFVHVAAMSLSLAMFVNPTVHVVDIIRQRPLRELSLQAGQEQQSGELLAMVGSRMPSTVFYSQQPVAFFESASQALHALLHEAKPG
eukprot:SM000214S06779  [mRNA]  locus=s214:117930:121225:+ [translate_table: standard]